MPRRFTTLLNPLSRTALFTLAWNRRHDIFRWGRSLAAELQRPESISPQRLYTVTKVLAAVTSDEGLSGAKELKQVRIEGDTVVLRVDPNWSRVHHLSQRLLQIKGINQVLTEADRETSPTERTS